MQFNDPFIGRWCAVLSRLAHARAWVGRLAQPRHRQVALSHGSGRCPAARLAIGLSLWLALTSGAAATRAETGPRPMSSAELELLETINGYRSAQGRAAWQPDAGLAQLARSHSQRMAVEGRLTHDGFQRRAAGTGSSLCVENLLQGTVTPARALHLWLQSRAHHDNVLEAGARFAGVGMSGSFVTLLACASQPERVSSDENAASGSGRR